MNKPRNNVVRYMNSVNKNAVHKNNKREHILNDDYFLNEHILWDEEMKNLYSFIEDDLEIEEEKDNEWHYKLKKEI